MTEALLAAVAITLARRGRAKPGCFLRLGNGEDSAILHSPKYDFNDGNLAVGAAPGPDWSNVS